MLCAMVESYNGMGSRSAWLSADCYTWYLTECGINRLFNFGQLHMKLNMMTSVIVVQEDASRITRYGCVLVFAIQQVD